MACAWGATAVEQMWVMRVGWDPGGRNCCSFQRRKMRDSANSFLVNLTSTLEAKLCRREFKAVPRVYVKHIKPHSILLAE